MSNLAWKHAHRDQVRAYNRAYRLRVKLGRPRDAEREAAASAHRHAVWYQRHRAAAMIAYRMKARGRTVTMDEARELLREYGPHYPLARGLSEAQRKWMRNLKERATRRGVRLNHFETVFGAWERGA